mmetsp:Transcript_29481/g.41097  ORF Transcript_29481/g.41097 Transcript_29481/m.41097 type:complete len:96 (-) Transcript_29481:120-407(-)
MFAATANQGTTALWKVQSMHEDTDENATTANTLFINVTFLSLNSNSVCFAPASAIRASNYVKCVRVASLRQLRAYYATAIDINRPIVQYEQLNRL